MAPHSESAAESHGDLAFWHERLDSHFGSLSEGRSVSGWPVFGLEHGLTATDLAALQKSVRAAVITRSVLGSGPLPWIVYSAEFGYGYTGEEFWQTFATETPSWPNTDYDRRSLRYQFEAFAAAYHGAEPEGRWGSFFKNIAWPITHAILPRDLQRQLARLLYDARLTFGEDTFKAAESLGRHLRDNCRYRSARFRQFAENTTLLGQIALALLLQEDGAPAGKVLGHDNLSSDAAATKATETAHVGKSTLILPSTLARIVNDLNKERESRDWLNEARRAAQAATKLRMKGLAGLRRRDPSGTVDEARPAATKLGTLETDFFLREQDNGSWSVWVKFPNMRAVAEELPGSRSTLFNVQGVVLGAGGVMLAKGRIVSDASPRVRLRDWPSKASTLLSFEGSPPELRALLDASFRIPIGVSWLFKIGADGQADHVKAHVLQPGASYLLLRRNAIEKPASGLSSAVIDCTGVFGVRIDMPLAVPDGLSTYLQLLGLAVSRSVRVRPAGLPPAKWSDDGIGEWVVGDTIIIAITADHALNQLSVTLDDGPDFTLHPRNENGSLSVFISLGKLAEGRHTLIVASPEEQRRDSGRDVGTLSTSAGKLEIVVRRPHAIDLSGARSSAISFLIYPDPPTLEDLWEERCEIHLAASGIETVKCRVELYDSSKTGLLWAQQLPAFSLPIDTAKWRPLFRKHAIDSAGEHYDAAQRCRIAFDGGQLGTVEVLAERDYFPLRWSVRNSGKRVSLMYSDAGEVPQVKSFESSAPTVDRDHEAVEAERGLDVPARGAMFTANSAGVIASVVAVPPLRASGSFAALSNPPRLGPTAALAPDLADLIETAALWDGARTSANPLAGSYRAHAVDAVSSRIFGALGGQRWADIESQLEIHQDLQQASVLMKRLVSDYRHERGIAAALEQRANELASLSAEARVSVFSTILAAFIDNAGNDDVGPRDQFVLRLATHPAAAIHWLAKMYGLPSGAYAGDAPKKLRSFITILTALPVVSRAARYCAVVTAVSQSKSEVTAKRLPEAWAWQ